jgi:hypothetical protein
VAVDVREVELTRVLAQPGAQADRREELESPGQ